MKAIPGLAKKLEMPYEIVEVISYDPRAKDLSAEVAKAKATKAELVMPVSRLQIAITGSRQAADPRSAAQPPTIIPTR